MPRSCHDCGHDRLGDGALAGYRCCDIDEREPDISRPAYLRVPLPDGSGWEREERPRALHRMTTGETWIREDAAPMTGCAYHTGTSRADPTPRYGTPARARASAAYRERQRQRRPLVPCEVCGEPGRGRTCGRAKCRGALGGRPRMVAGPPAVRARRTAAEAVARCK